MSAIQDIFRIYGPEYLALYGDRMPENHKKVMEAICECRSGSFGTILSTYFPATQPFTGRVNANNDVYDLPLDATGKDFTIHDQLQKGSVNAICP